MLIDRSFSRELLDCFNLYLFDLIKAGIFKLLSGLRSLFMIKERYNITNLALLIL